jgi:hypothetical protein
MRRLIFLLSLIVGSTAAVRAQNEGILNTNSVNPTQFGKLADAATKHNSGVPPLWQVNMGSTVDPASFGIGGAPYTDILNEIKILSTPVIDRTGNAIYVVNERPVGSRADFYSHAQELTTGNEPVNPAARGWWIAIYAAGAGLLSPALADRKIVSRGESAQGRYDFIC